MQSGLSTLRHIREALEAAGDALISARLEALEANEAVLALAVSRLRHLPHEAPRGDQWPAYRDELRRARLALHRCVRLGTALNEFVRAALVAQGRAGAYDRGGQETVEVRAGGLHVRG